RLKHAEEPQRMAEAEKRGHCTADEGPEEGGGEPDGCECEAAVEGAVAHVEEEGSGECLCELVGELVEDHEGQDLERAVSGEELEERLPHRLAERRRRGWQLLRLRRAPGQDERGDVGEREARVDDRPRVSGGERDAESAGDEERGAVER